MNTSHPRDLPIGAFTEVASGNIFGWFSDDENYGIPVRVTEVLADGSLLDEYTSDETWPIVVKAYRRFNYDPPSRNFGKCCRGLLALARRKTLNP